MSKGLTYEQVRKIALSLPEAVEQDHFGRPSFRIRGKIFATMWDLTHLNVMIGPVRVLEVVKYNPKACKELWWGRKLACVQVDLTVANAKLVKELLTEAWTRKAPRTLVHSVGVTLRRRPS